MDMLLSYSSKPQTSIDFPSASTYPQPSADVSASTSQTKTIADEIDLNMTDKLFEDISKKFSNPLKNEPFIDALASISKSMDDSSSQFGPPETKLEQPGINDEDLELKSVVKELSNFLEMKES